MLEKRKTMTNGIAARQNEENAIEMLAAQRQIYSDVKKYSAISNLLSIWLPFMMSFILLLLPAETNWRSASYILAIVSMLFSFIIDKYIDDKKELAAYVQQKFDVYVYNMPWNERFFGKEKNVNRDIATYSKRIMGNDSSKKFLYNWYVPAVDNNELLMGITQCQRENICWDVGLRKRFRLVSVIMIAFLCSCVFAIGVWNNESVTMLLCRLAFIVPMVEWLLNTIKKINKDIERLSMLDGIANNNIVKKMEELQDVQRLIFVHRKECFTIPDCFFRVFRENDEDTARRVISIECQEIDS